MPCLPLDLNTLFLSIQQQNPIISILHLKSLQGYGKATLWKPILKRGNLQLAIANTSQERNLQMGTFGCHRYILVYWEIHDFYTLLGWVENNLSLPTLNTDTHLPWVVDRRAASGEGSAQCSHSSFCLRGNDQTLGSWDQVLSSLPGWCAPGLQVSHICTQACMGISTGKYGYREPNAKK